MAISKSNDLSDHEIDPYTGERVYKDPFGEGYTKAKVASESDHLKSLGNTNTQYAYDRVTPEVLETFPNPMPPGSGRLLIKQPEFTSLCPKTGQPDFATIVIRYAPREKCVESKSLKLYLGSFRNVGEFHESCVARIAKDLFDLMQPDYLFVEGQFTPRGGIPFWPTVELYHDEYLDAPSEAAAAKLHNDAMNPNQ